MKPTLLIVDDHDAFRAAARTMLEAEGFDVVGEAESGIAALSRVAELHPNVVLLDVQLPDLDGFAVAKMLMAQNGGSGPVIVLMSVRGDFGCDPFVAACGARGFVPKERLSGPALEALLAAA
jgi:DNA-binding NarL/FixJ family response regulator